MKGTNRFTAHEALYIMRKLNQLKELPLDLQKKDREGLRDKGFYISNYGQSLTASDFDDLVQNNIIEITENKDFYEEQKINYIKN